MTGRKFQLVIFCVDVAIRCKKCGLNIYSYEKVLSEYTFSL